ncbi:MAG: hypothetical protein MJ214_03210 [Bacilli bacterium]|nr:hypothetical protein [Bacilli bacterium]
MKKLKLFIAPVMVVSFLTSCGGGGGDNPDPDPTTTFSVALLAEEGKFSDGSITRFIKDVPAGTKLNQITGYEAPTMENLDYTFGDWLTPSGDVVPVDVTIDSDIVLKASYVFSAEYNRKVYLAKLEEDSKYANLAIPLEDFGVKFDYIDKSIGDIKDPGVNSIYQYVYHAIALDDKQTVQLTSSGQIKAAYAYADSLVKYILSYDNPRYPDKIFSSDILLEHFFNQIKTIASITISTQTQEKAIIKLCNVASRQLVFGAGTAAQLEDGLEYLDLFFSKYITLITNTNDQKVINTNADIGSGVLSSAIYIKDATDYNNVNAFIESKIQELITRATSEEDYTFLMHLVSGYSASYIKLHSNPDDLNKIDDLYENALQNYFTDNDYALKRTSDIISRFLYAFGTNNIATLDCLSSLVSIKNKFYEIASAYDNNEIVDKICYFAISYTEGIKNFNEIYECGSLHHMNFDSHFWYLCDKCIDLCAYEKGKTNRFLGVLYDSLTSMCDFMANFLERLKNQAIVDVDVEIITSVKLIANDIFDMLVAEDVEEQKLKGLGALASSLIESSTFSGGSPILLDTLEKVKNSYYDIYTISPENAVYIGKVCGALETGRCHQHVCYGDLPEGYYEKEMKRIKDDLLKYIFSCPFPSRIEPLIETIIDMYKVALVAIPYSRTMASHKDEAFAMTYQLFDQFISMIKSIINKWPGSDNLFMAELNMIRKTITDKRFFFLACKNAKKGYDREEDNIKGFNNFFFGTKYFESFFSTKYFCDKNFDKIDDLVQAYFDNYLYPELACYDDSIVDNDFQYETAAQNTLGVMNSIIAS